MRYPQVIWHTSRQRPTSLGEFLPRWQVDGREQGDCKPDIEIRSGAKKESVALTLCMCDPPGARGSVSLDKLGPHPLLQTLLCSCEGQVSPRATSSRTIQALRAFPRKPWKSLTTQARLHSAQLSLSLPLQTQPIAAASDPEKAVEVKEGREKVL